MSYNFVNLLCVSIKQTYFHTLADLDCIFFLATYAQVSNGWEVLWSWWGFSDPNAYSGGYVELLLSAPSKGPHISPGKWQTPIEASCLPWSVLLQRKNKTFHVLVFTCCTLTLQYIFIACLPLEFAAFWLSAAEVWLPAVVCVCVYLPRVLAAHGTFSKGFGVLLAGAPKSREPLPKKSESSITDMIVFIAVFLLILFCFVLLMAAGSESCFWTLKTSFPFSLAYVEHLSSESVPLQEKKK